MDLALMMTDKDVQALSALLRRAHRRGRVQLQVLTVPSLGGEPIEQVSIQITDQWKLGSEKEDNGVLLLVAKEERTIRLEVGQGLEGVIPDAIANRIIQDIMIPYFRAGSPERGIKAGALEVLRLADPEYFKSTGYTRPKRPRHSKHSDYRESQGTTGKVLEALFYFICLLVLIIGRSRRRGWGSGPSFGTGGFGGGWSGGGGGFSGGGATGRW